LKSLERYFAQGGDACWVLIFAQSWAPTHITAVPWSLMPGSVYRSARLHTSRKCVSELQRAIGVLYCASRPATCHLSTILFPSPGDLETNMDGWSVPASRPYLHPSVGTQLEILCPY